MYDVTTVWTSISLDLGAKHQQYGVRREHLDLLALVYCSAVRGVVATQGTVTNGLGITYHG